MKIKTQARSFPGSVTIMKLLTMKHNTEKYKALIKKESYISINDNERDAGFLIKENIKE